MKTRMTQETMSTADFVKAFNEAMTHDDIDAVIKLWSPDGEWVVMATGETFKGLSSPLVNVIWALCNILIGYFLFQLGQVSSANLPSLAVFFFGAAAISVMSSVNFQKKDRE